MSLNESSFSREIIRGIEKFRSRRDHNNFYFQTRVLTGSGKSSLHENSARYCREHKIPYCHIKNLCSIKNGIKVQNRKRTNLEFVLLRVSKDAKIYFCDEVKDSRLYKTLKEGKFFVYTGYEYDVDIGEDCEEFQIIDIDTQFNSNQLFKILIKKFPGEKLSIIEAIKIAPNIGQATRLIERFQGNKFDPEKARRFIEKINDKKKVNRLEAHSLVLKCFSQGNMKCYEKTI